MFDFFPDLHLLTLLSSCTFDPLFWFCATFIECVQLVDQQTDHIAGQGLHPNQRRHRRPQDWPVLWQVHPLRSVRVHSLQGRRRPRPHRSLPEDPGPGVQLD